MEDVFTDGDKPQPHFRNLEAIQVNNVYISQATKVVKDLETLIASADQKTADTKQSRAILIYAAAQIHERLRERSVPDCESVFRPFLTQSTFERPNPEVEGSIRSSNATHSVEDLTGGRTPQSPSGARGRRVTFESTEEDTMGSAQPVEDDEFDVSSIDQLPPPPPPNPKSPKKPTKKTSKGSAAKGVAKGLTNKISKSAKSTTSRKSRQEGSLPSSPEANTSSVPNSPRATSTKGPKALTKQLIFNRTSVDIDVSYTLEASLEDATKLYRRLHGMMIGVDGDELSINETEARHMVDLFYGVLGNRLGLEHAGTLMVQYNENGEGMIDAGLPQRIANSVADDDSIPAEVTPLLTCLGEVIADDLGSPSHLSAYHKHTHKWQLSEQYQRLVKMVDNGVNQDQALFDQGVHDAFVSLIERDGVRGPRQGVGWSTVVLDWLTKQYETSIPVTVQHALAPGRQKKGPDRTLRAAINTARDIHEIVHHFGPAILVVAPPNLHQMLVRCGGVSKCRAAYPIILEHMSYLPNILQFFNENVVRAIDIGSALVIQPINSAPGHGSLVERLNEAARGGLGHVEPDEVEPSESGIDEDEVMSEGA